VAGTFATSSGAWSRLRTYANEAQTLALVTETATAAGVFMFRIILLVLMVLQCSLIEWAICSAVRRLSARGLRKRRGASSSNGPVEDRVICNVDLI